MSHTLENTTRATHSWYSNSSVSDIRDSTTKIIDITLPTRGIICEYSAMKKKSHVEFRDQSLDNGLWSKWFAY
jgi:hypothetical protein